MGWKVVLREGKKVVGTATGFASREEATIYAQKKANEIGKPLSVEQEREKRGGSGVRSHRRGRARTRVARSGRRRNSGGTPRVHVLKTDTANGATMLCGLHVTYDADGNPVPGVDWVLSRDRASRATCAKCKAAARKKNGKGKKKERVKKPRRTVIKTTSTVVRTVNGKRTRVRRHPRANPVARFVVHQPDEARLVRNRRRSSSKKNPDCRDGSGRFVPTPSCAGTRLDEPTKKIVVRGKNYTLVGKNRSLDVAKKVAERLRAQGYFAVVREFGMGIGVYRRGRKKVAKPKSTRAKRGPRAGHFNPGEAAVARVGRRAVALATPYAKRMAAQGLRAAADRLSKTNGGRRR